MSSVQTHLFGRQRYAFAGALGAIVLASLVACGGGGGGGGNDAANGGGAPTTGSYTSGTISGFGSIIVNNVRFDDSAAQVYDDDSNRRSSNDLKLGAYVEIEASRIDRASGTGTATVIRYGSEIVGPITAVNSVANTISLLGQTVEVASTTVFDDRLAGRLSALAVGVVVEIHAQWDASRNVYVASRIEPKLNATSYKLRGTVANLNTIARTFSIGGTLLNYSNANAPTTLTNGAWVRVNLQTTSLNGQWLISNFGNESRSRGDHSEAEIEGIITAWTSATQFSVDGLAVNANSATFREGRAGVVLGATVEVEGAIVNGVMVATKVHLEDHSSRGRGEDYELHGIVSALNTGTKTFSLRGQTVRYSANTTWKDGSESQLANGSRVEIKGDLFSDGVTLIASRIDFE